MSKKHLYFILHKPYKVLSQFSDEDGNLGLNRIIDLPKDVYPVGRLDLDSEGLLILTNDKKLNHALLNPAHEHSRTYWVEVDGQPSGQSLKKLSSGVEINLKGSMYSTKPAEVKAIAPTVQEREPPVNYVKHPKRSWLEISLKEGKNRQVRKMTAKVGHPTLRLIRVSIGLLALGNMKPGQITQISKKSIYQKLGI
ncbi:MAG: pseudouridine synthase [Bacteroidota bacterium]